MNELKKKWDARQSLRSESGYILVTILALMFVSILLVSAMLMLAQSTMRIEETGRVRERQARAAEGAVDVAINQIRNSASIASAEPVTIPPSPPPGSPGYEPFKDPYVNRGAAGGVCDPIDDLIRVDTFDVRIFCYPEGLWEYDADSNGNLVPGIPQDDGAIAVRLVGDEYVGDSTINLDNTPSVADVVTTDRARTWRTSFPFSTAMSGFNSTELTATKGQLLYNGYTPLKITGAVQVKNQIAAVLSSGNGPALQVNGATRQGGEGMFASSNAALDCGIALRDDPNNSPRADVVTDTLFLPLNEGLRCNQGDVSSLGQAGTTPPNGEWNNARVQSNRYNTDWTDNDAQPNGHIDNSNVPTDCDSFQVPNTNTPAPVIVIEPGAYDARATARLNSMFTGCDNRTWIFPGGDYWFDVNDPALPDSNPAKNSLVFNNRTSNWVFGPPVSSPTLTSYGNYSVSNFPDEACDRGWASASDGSRGTSITLSSRTGIHHRAGRVAICGPIGVHPGGNWNELYGRSTGQGTAIHQRPATSLGARLLPSGLTADDFGVGSPSVAAIQSEGGAVIRANQDMPPPCWDSGACTFNKTYRADNFGQGSVNGAYMGPSVVTSAIVDVTAAGDRVINASQDLAQTRLDVTLSNSTTCYMIYGPNRSDARRLPGNNTVVSYDLFDSAANGNCDTVLAGATRNLFYGADIRSTFTLNPPTMENTQFDWWDWWPWMQNVIYQACQAWNGWGIADWLNDNIGLINWYWQCDDRPMQVSYSVDSIALRLGWTPQMDTPVNAAEYNATTCTNCIAFLNAADGARVNTDGSPNTAVASVTKPAGWGSSFSNLRYRLSDPTLLDGFLPLRDIYFNYRAMRTPWNESNGSVDDNDGNSFRFTLKTRDGVWCRKTVRLHTLSNSALTEQTAVALVPRNGIVNAAPPSGGFREVLEGCIRPTDVDPGPGEDLRMLWNGVSTDPNVVREVEVGQILSHQDRPAGGSDVPVYLDVEVYMSNPAIAKTISIDWVSMSATAGGGTGSTVTGYPKPLDPFTVTWSPLTPDTGGDASWGDASFNVWGSVSVPDNDVRVIWNWDTSRYAGPLGFPIFTAGKQPFQRCNPGNEAQCQPALVAAGFGSWTTTSTNGFGVNQPWANLTAEQMPDPLAGSGFERKPFRRVKLLACVVDPDGSGTNGDLLPRVEARVVVGDRARASATDPVGPPQTGANVRISSWNAMRSPSLATTNATTDDCILPAP